MTMDPMGCRTAHHRLHEDGLISWAARVTESLLNSLNSLCLLFLEGKPAHHCWPVHGHPLFINYWLFVKAVMILFQLPLN